MMKVDPQYVKTVRESIRWVLLGLFAWVLSACGGQVGPTSADKTPWNAPASESHKSRRMAGETQIEQAPSARPGLATGWGDEVPSQLKYVDFTRASSKPVGGVAMIRYNDSGGASSMGVNTRYKTVGMAAAAGGVVQWGIKSGWGTLPNYWWRGGRMVIGKKGKTYAIVVKNISANWIEAVLSVDGLDVIDGKAASTRKKGYLIGPGKTLEVKGFRTSTAAVAAFKFSSVGASYANLSGGDSRNVGVIGLAVFSDKLSAREAQQRTGASPFAEAPAYQAR